MRKYLIPVLMVSLMLNSALVAVLIVKADSKEQVGEQSKQTLEEKQHEETNQYVHDETSPLYANELTPDTLSKAIEDGEDKLVYFYQPSCIYCQKIAPVLEGMMASSDIKLSSLNLEDNREAWMNFNIEGTPTIIHYKDGQEYSRIVGAQPEEVLSEWFSDNETE